MKQRPVNGPAKEGQVRGRDATASRAEQEQLPEPDAPNSKYSIDECLRYAEWGFRNGLVSSPQNYARAIHRSGAADSSIERFLWEERLRLEHEKELAEIQSKYKREIEDLERVVGQATRAWAAERAARVRESAFAGAVFAFSIVMLCAALWIELGPLAVERWRRMEGTQVTRSVGSGGHSAQPTVTPVPSPGAGKGGQGHP